MATTTTPSPVSRRRIRLLGLDTVSITGPAAIRTVLASGDVARMDAAGIPWGDLPCWVRWLFPLGRQYSGARGHGWFLPFKASDDPAYAPRRGALDRVFADGNGYTRGDVTAMAAALSADPPVPPGRVRYLFAAALCRAFTGGAEAPPLEPAVAAASEKAVEGLISSFAPWVWLPARYCLPRVWAWGDAVLSRASRGVMPDGAPVPPQVAATPTGDGAATDELTPSLSAVLPPSAAVDIGHCVASATANAEEIFTAAVAHPNATATDVLTRLAPPVPQVARLAVRGGTLGGLLPTDDPAVAGVTVVLLQVGAAAAATGDVAWTFGVGDGVRGCAAAPLIRAYVADVLAELRRAG